MMARCASAALASGNVCATRTRRLPWPASRASSGRAAWRISVPGSAPGAPPSALMPSARPRRDAAIVGNPLPVGYQLQRDVDCLISADEVECRVDALRRGGPDAVRKAGAIGHRDRAETAQQLMPHRARGADDGSPAGNGQLDRHQAHAASRAVHQYRVACGHRGRDQRVPGGGTGQHQPARFWPAQRRRLGDQRVTRHHQVSGVATRYPVGDDLIANRQRPGSRRRRPGPDSGHHSCCLESEPQREPRRVAAHGTAVELVVDGVHPAGANGDACLARGRVSDWLISESEHFRAAVSGCNHDCGHVRAQRRPVTRHSPPGACRKLK